MSSQNKGKLAGAFLRPTALAFFYGIFLFCYEVKFLRQIVPAVHPVLILWAAVQSAYHLGVRRRWREIPMLRLILIFALAAGTTGLVRLEAGAVHNAKAWVMTMLPLLAFYPVCLLEENREKAVLKALLGAAVVVFLASAAGVALYLLRVSREVSVWGITELIGFRIYDPTVPASGIILYGIYTDTNHAAAYAAMFAVYSVALYRGCERQIFGRPWKNKLGKGFAAASFGVQMAYFPLANSRGGWLAAAIAVCVGVFLYLRRVVNRRWLKSAAGALLTAAVVCLVLLGMRDVLSGISVSMDREAVEAVATDAPDVLPTEPGDSFSKDSGFFAGGRLGIWQEGIRLFCHYPIFGTGPGNHQFYARRHFDSGTLIHGKALHNSFLDLLVDYGIPGFSLLMTFWVAAALRVLRRKSWDQTMCAAAGCITLAVCAAVLLSCVFINTTAMYFLMTVLAGYLIPGREGGGT